MLLITHPYFNFETANEFMVVNKFSSLICSSWNDFMLRLTNCLLSLWKLCSVEREVVKVSP